MLASRISFIVCVKNHRSEWDHISFVFPSLCSHGLIDGCSLMRIESDVRIAPFLLHYLVMKRYGSVFHLDQPSQPITFLL